MGSIRLCCTAVIRALAVFSGDVAADSAFFVFFFLAAGGPAALAGVDWMSPIFVAASAFVGEIPTTTLSAVARSSVGVTDADTDAGDATSLT